ncbi:MAG: hypothetical protein KY440_03565 [Actinobacteria bacterium]|nr:hypothetical protein [Actinomycetota bacterium]
MSMAENPDALTRRIQLLAAASVDEPEGEGAAVAALVGALRAEIGSVRAELGALRSETGAVRSDLDGLGGRLTGSVAASRSETGTLVRRVAELSTRLDGVGGRVDDVRNGLPGLSRELREGLEQIPVRTSSRLDELTTQLEQLVGDRVEGAATDIRRTMTAALDRETQTTAQARAAVEDTRGALESRLAVLEDTLDGLSERIEALARDGASTTTERLERLAQSVEGLDRRVAEEGRDSTELLVDRVGEVTGTRLAELENTLFDRIADVLRLRNDDLRRELRGALEVARGEAQQDREAVAEIAATVHSTLDGFGSTLAQSMTGLGDSVSAALVEGRGETRADFELFADRFGGVIDALRADLVQREETSAGRITGLQSAVEGRLEQVRAQVAKAMTVISSDVATEIGTLTPRIDELTVAGSAVNESVRLLRSDVVGTVEALRDRLVSANTDSTEVLRGAMTETRAEVAEITRALREDLLERIEEKYGVVADRLGELARDVTGSTSATRATAERLSVLAGLSEQTTSSLTDVRAAVEQRLDQLDTSVGAHVITLESTFTSRLADVRAELNAGTVGTREAGERLTALTAATERQREEVQARLDVVRDDMVEAARDLRKELITQAAAQVAGLTERLAGLDSTVNASSARLTDRLDALDGALIRNAELAEQTTAGLARVDGVTSELQAAVSSFRLEWPTRTFEVVQGAKAVAEGVVLQIRSEVEAQLERVREELARAVAGVADASSGLGSGTEQLSEAGKALVDYLERRDLLLEAERDRVLYEVLDTFAAGLSVKDRAALAERVGSAVDRRRDARDAQRYRTAPPAPVRPNPDDLPSAVRQLAPAEPPAVAAPAARAKTKPAPRKTAAKKAAASPPRPADRPGSARTGGLQTGSRAASVVPAKPAARTVPAEPSAKSSAGRPSGATSGSSTPRPTRPVPPKPAPARSAAARPAPVPPPAAKPIPGKSVPGKSVAGKPVPGRAVPGSAPARSKAAPARSAASSPAGGTPSRYPAATPKAPSDFTAVKVRPTTSASSGRSSRPQDRQQTPTRDRASAADRRGRLDAMPTVPGPNVALDAAAPPPRPSRPAPARHEAPEAETSWASRASAAEDDDSNEDVSLRALFRRRRS